MERRQELTTRCSSENIWNMDESGCFLKTLPDKGLVEKANKQKVTKDQSKDSQLPYLSQSKDSRFHIC